MSPIQHMINITCEDGFHMLPSDTYMSFLLINCKTNGDWWRPVPECVKIEPCTKTDILRGVVCRTRAVGCLLPPYPAHVEGYRLWKCEREACKMQAGWTLAPKSNMFVTCEPGYATAAEQDTPVCEDGHWTRPAPQCYKTCPAVVTGDALDAVCGETEELCDVPQPFNITATFTCQAPMKLSSEATITCGADGLWSAAPPTCTS